MSDSQIIRNSVDLIHEKVGEDCEIYSVGFSLGANHLLRYLGDNANNSGIKAAISVSNPFDLMTTVIKLRRRMFGIYDRSINMMLAKPFLENKFKIDELDEETQKKMKKAKTLFDFDNDVRAKLLGYNSIHGLYRNSSW